MSSYLDAVREKLEQLNNGGKKSSNTSGPRLTFWKPELGQHDIRFLPYTDKNGQPLQEVSYYDSKLLSDRRFPTSQQFGLEDPIFETLTHLRKDRSTESYKLWKNLQPRERYYAPILVRGHEDLGVQIWEISPKYLKEIYSILAHPDYKDENLMDAENGYDFTVTVSPTDKTFNGYAVKDIKLQARRKSSPLAKSAAEMDKIVASIPNLEEYFKRQAKDVDELRSIIENFLAGAGSSEEETSTNNSFSDDDGVSDAEAVATQASVDKTPRGKSRKSAIDDAFKGL